MNCFRMESYKIKFKAALLDTEKTLALATQSNLVSSTVFNPLTRQQVERGSPKSDHEQATPQSSPSCEDTTFNGL